MSLLDLKPTRGIAVTRLEIKLDPDSTLHAECKVPSLALQDLLSSLADLDLAMRGGSVQVKKLIFDAANKQGWELDFSVSTNVSKDYPDANFKINYLWVSKECACGKRHKVFVHRCFDNRQAIGTNLLRFMIANQSPTKSPRDDYSFIALVADEKAKRASWDGSVGSYEEYFFAVNGGYKLLNLPPIDFAIIRP